MQQKNEIRKKYFQKDTKPIDISFLIVYYISVLKDTKGDESVDKYKLEYEMKKKGISIDEMCKKLKMSRTSFYRKCNCKSEFTLSEIKTIIEVLNLESPCDIFFANQVS